MPEDEKRKAEEIVVAGEKAEEPSTKRQQVAKETPAKTPDTAAENGASVREKPAGDEPEAKRLKPTPPEPKAVRKQVEYYLSDENLKFDKFFHEKIAADTDGWLEMQLILSCNKMQAMRATKEDVIEALKGSKLEIKDGGSAIRRPGAAALPPLEARPSHPRKSSLHAHDGGIIAAVSNIPEEQSWQQVKEKLKEKLPAKVQLWFVSEVNDKNQAIIACSPFENDLRFFEELQIELGGTKTKCEICQGELLQSSLKLIPKHVRDKRERESRKRQKERNRPILVGTQRFVNVAALRGRVKEILNSRSDGEQLKPDGSDFKLIKALLTFHPKGEEKAQGLIGMKVTKSIKGDGQSRCFFMLKEGGVEEDFSAKKCLDAIEQNPPYVQLEPKKDAGSAPTEKNDAEKKKDEAELKAEDNPAAEEKKAEEAKPAEEEKKAEEAKPAKEEKKAEETKSAEDERKAEEAKPAEEEKKAEETKPADEKNTEEAKSAEEERKAD